MLSRWPIRYKLLLGVTMLCLIVTILSVSGFRGAYSYRRLVRSISRRAAELPQAAELTRKVGELRFLWSSVYPTREFPVASRYDAALVRDAFPLKLLDVQAELAAYKEQLDNGVLEDPHIGDRGQERETVEQIEQSLDRIAALNQHDWVLDDLKSDDITEELENLNKLSQALPTFLHTRMKDLRDESKLEYRALIVLTWAATILTGTILLLSVCFFYLSVFLPLRSIIRGSRRVAQGDFNHRIQLHTNDEMDELARAMNDMTARFQEIRDDLDQQVKLRTKEVVRSEQLASVGFLAAGVAHEINNPLASIAWCAESLESRIADILPQPPPPSDESQPSETEVLRRYLRTIQDESFRCKGITERLLDFSRLGDVERQTTDLQELVRTVIDMVRHLGKYRNKHTEFQCDKPVSAVVNSQEIKQVVLNLITNALDSLDAGGTVQVSLTQQGDEAHLVVADDGCGMSDEVLNHVFEPFFTRRRDGQGTGLGLSISCRIVDGHGGRIRALSDGPGKGSRFEVRLPLGGREDKNNERQNRAA